MWQTPTTIHPFDFLAITHSASTSVFPLNLSTKRCGMPTAQPSTQRMISRKVSPVCWEIVFVGQFTNLGSSDFESSGTVVVGALVVVVSI
jgi:hypothetical protein